MASLLVLVFAAAMIAAALTDLASMTIANRLVVALAAAFLLFGLAAGLTATAFLLHLAAGLGVLAITFGCFAAGWMGGGDAKLMAAVALWLGPTPELASFALWTSILGGVLTLAFLAAPLPSIADHGTGSGGPSSPVRYRHPLWRRDRRRGTGHGPCHAGVASRLTSGVHHP